MNIVLRFWLILVTLVENLRPIHQNGAVCHQCGHIGDTGDKNCLLGYKLVTELLKDVCGQPNFTFVLLGLDFVQWEQSIVLLFLFFFYYAGRNPHLLLPCLFFLSEYFLRVNYFNIGFNLFILLFLLLLN